MSKVVSLMVVLFLVVFCGECHGELKFGFYERKCGLTDVEDVVKGVVEFWQTSKRDKNTAAALLRMQFHDCFVNGCDASILLDGENSEKKAGPNGSVRGYELIDEIKKALEAKCEGLVSCADIIAMATRDAVVLNGGKWYNVETGRKDGNVSLASNVNLPGPSISVSDSITAFGRKKLTPTDMVYLLGGHTVGNTHCSFIQDRVYNFNNTGGPDPTMSKLLLSELRMKCPRVPSFDNIVPLDRRTPSLVDKTFFQEIQMGNGVFKIDQQIALDVLTKKIVNDVVKDPNFYTNFGNAMVKLGKVEVLTDGQGEVRTSCRAVNKKKPLILGLF